MVSDQAHYELLNVGEVRPEGWMLDQMRRDLRGFAGHLDELTQQASGDSFGIARQYGTEDPAKRPPNHPAWRWWWRGETEAVWLDGLVRMAFLCGDDQACAKVRRLMTHILACQEPDGYIGVYQPAVRYRHAAGNGELWTQSRILIALLAYGQLTSDPTVLQAVQRAADLTLAHYGPGRPYFQNAVTDGGMAHGLMFVDVMEWLHRVTGEARYVEFGEFLYTNFDAWEPPTRDHCVQNLLDPAKVFDGHTPHVMEELRVTLWLADATGKDVYRRCSEAAFEKTLKHVTVSGACIGDENIKGRAPTGEMYYEYCAITELLAALHSRVQKTGQGRWADSAERLAFNAAQGARFADGMGISYLTRDNRSEATRAMFARGKAKYSPTHEEAAVCCNPAAVKLLPYHLAGMWLRTTTGRPGLTAVCYGPCRLSTMVGSKRVIITERTSYPFEERVFFDVEQADAIAMLLEFRIPRWARRAVLRIGSEQWESSTGSLRVDRIWQTGDRAELEFEASVTLEESCDSQAVVVRGPLIYAAPLADKRERLKDYPLPGFHDYDVLPAAAPAPAASELSMPRASASFELVREPGELKDPWANPPLALRAQLSGPDGKTAPVSLVPMGCTVLRRVTFPWARA